LFLYFKDKMFFDKFVKPFLMKKFKKDLIDSFLLDETHSLVKNLTIS